MFELVGLSDWVLDGLTILSVDRLEDAVRIILLGIGLLCLTEFFLDGFEILVTDVLLNLVLPLFIDAHVVPVMNVFIVLPFILIFQKLIVIGHLMVVHGSMMWWVELRIGTCLMVQRFHHVLLGRIAEHWLLLLMRVLGRSVIAGVVGRRRVCWLRVVRVVIPPRVVVELILRGSMIELLV